MQKSKAELEHMVSVRTHELVEEREKLNNDASEAGVGIMEQQIARAEMLTVADKKLTLNVDMSKAKESLDLALERLAVAG